MPMMTRGRPVSGPAPWLLRRFGGSAPLDGDRGGQRPGPDLVEARAAVHGPIVAWRERDDGLSPTGPADRGMEFAGAFVGTRALGDRSAGGTPLRVVGQPFAG